MNRNESDLPIEKKLFMDSSNSQRFLVNYWYRMLIFSHHKLKTTHITLFIINSHANKQLKKEQKMIDNKKLNMM